MMNSSLKTILHVLKVALRDLKDTFVYDEYKIMMLMLMFSTLTSDDDDGDDDDDDDDDDNGKTFPSCWS